MSDEKHIVCLGATVYCNRSLVNNSPATAIPITITSQSLIVANGNKPVATNKDNTVINMNFGICNDPKYTPPTPKPPCMANVIWQNVFEGGEITEAGLKFLTEDSEAICNICSVPGKIKIAFHGQIANISPEEIHQASPIILAFLSPWNFRRIEELEFREL